MSDDSTISDPPDICLILRAHAEAQWLSSEVVPLVRKLEVPGLVAEERLGAALAYLELLWIDAGARAAETDAARAALDRAQPERDRVLCEKARHYYAAVCRLRGLIGARVGVLTRPTADSHTLRDRDASLRPAVALHPLRRGALGR